MPQSHSGLSRLLAHILEYLFEAWPLLPDDVNRHAHGHPHRDKCPLDYGPGCPRGRIQEPSICGPSPRFLTELVSDLAQCRPSRRIISLGWLADGAGNPFRKERIIAMPIPACLTTFEADRIPIHDVPSTGLLVPLQGGHIEEHEKTQGHFIEGQDLLNAAWLLDA